MKPNSPAGRMMARAKLRRQIHKTYNIVSEDPVQIERKDVHPHRYPKHADPDKGQVHGGECNITACEHQRAEFWNCMTHGFYCVSCARGINYDPKVPPICIRVPHKPTIAEMDALHTNWSKA